MTRPPAVHEIPLQLASKRRRLKGSSGTFVNCSILSREIYADKNFAEALKEQAMSQAAEYDRLADQYNKETGKAPSDKRVD